MNTQQRFTLLRKLLKTFGLSDARIEELIAADHQIDQLVYQLYGLTSEEIKIVK